MSKLQSMSRVCARVAVLTVALALGGCYLSETPLIQPQNADYPFQSITFISVSDETESDDPDRITLVRHGDAYVELNKEDEETYLFALVEDGVLIGQLTAEEDDDKLGVLYAVVQIENDQVMTILSPICDDTPADILAAAGIIKTDKQYADECLISSLDQLKTLARMLVGTDIKRETYRIVELTK